MPRARIVGSFASKEPYDRHGVEWINCTSTNFDTLRDMDFSVVVNLTRGESPIEFEFHRGVIELANCRGARYLYASSSNAVDKDVSKPHREDDPAESQTEYGQFKARSERELFQHCRRPLAFRFSAIHGWAPGRIARTEEFLRKLAGGENVSVPTGVVQNRAFVGNLAAQISILVCDRNAEGIFHLGAADESDEINFSQKLAAAFGYPADRIVPGEAVNWNMVTQLKNFTDRYPDFVVPSESETIACVCSQLELARYASHNRETGNGNRAR